MNNIQSLTNVLKKITFHPADLRKNELFDEDEQIFNSWIENFYSGIDGKYSVFCSQQIVLWEGKLTTQSRLILTYPPETSSSHYYLLFFKSTNCLNIRVNVTVRINEKLLNVQSEAGSILWASNVGLELMIPTNTHVTFQLHVVPKTMLLKELESTTILITEKHKFFAESDVPLFYFSKKISECPNLFDINKNKLYYQRKREDILNSMINYFSLNDELSNEKFTLWDFHKMLIIEQQIAKMPADLKPNLAQLAQLFNFSPRVFSKLFSQLFGKSITEYHCSIHMEYACWLLETQQLSVVEVSNQLEFKSKKMFSNMFKSHYLVNPKIYKAKAI